MVKGMLRWFVVESDAADTRRAIFEKLGELGIHGNPWSSRTATLTFLDDNRAKHVFNQLDRWLRDRCKKATKAQPFRCVLCASLPNAFRSH